MNTSHDAIVINQTNFKKIAKKIKKHLAEQNLQIPLTAVNEVFAKSLGYRNYDALHSTLNTTAISAEKENLISENNNVSQLEALYKYFLIYIKQYSTLRIILPAKYEHNSAAEESITYMLKRNADKNLLLDDSLFINMLDKLFLFINYYVKNHNIDFKDFFTTRYMVPLEIAISDYRKDDESHYYSMSRVLDDKKNPFYNSEEINHFLAIPHIRYLFSFLSITIHTLSEDIEKTLFSNDFLILFVSKYYGLRQSVGLDNIRQHVYYEASFFAKESNPNGEPGRPSSAPRSQKEQILDIVQDPFKDINTILASENFFLYLIKYDQENKTKLAYQLFQDILKFNALFTINNTLLHML